MIQTKTHEHYHSYSVVIITALSLLHSSIIIIIALLLSLFLPSMSSTLLPKIQHMNYSNIKEYSKRIIPILTNSLHKGQNGKIGVIGGSINYTGAPFYSGMSALRFGGDLSMIYASESSAIPIKSYSPELIVTPFYSENELFPSREYPNKCANVVINQFNRMDSLVIGPGLGRADCVNEIFTLIIMEAIKHEIPLILDADALWFLTYPENLKLINGYTKCVLTPNQVEFNRLVASSKCLVTSDNEHIYNDLMSLESVSGVDSNDESIKANKVLHLAKLLNGVTILCKGRKDVISNGDSDNNVYLVDMEGCPKRCGGQGDILAGCLGVASFWGIRCCISTNDYGNLQNYQIQACLLSSAVTKLASAKAYSSKKRGMTSPDIIEEICHVFPDYL